ncbi:MAG: MBL fold metallo-hydrolase [Clostridia bacterium]|nr:MBL fold metallo-hydrolase [Clostridia bacterium]
MEFKHAVSSHFFRKRSCFFALLWAPLFTLFLALTAASADVPLTPALDPPKVIDRISDPDAWPDFAFAPQDDLLEIYFPFIRDQDCAIFRYQGQVWMLDCGDERAQTEIVPLLSALGITRIDKMINSHPHHDHLNGLYAVNAAAPVQELDICFPEDATQHMTAAMEYCKGNGIPVVSFQDEEVMGMGDGFVTFLHWLKASELDTVNNRSAVTMVSFGNCNFLFTADIEYQGQRSLFEFVSPEHLKADLLRYPHHGKSAMIRELFEAVSPALAIITNTNRIVELRESTKFLGYMHVPAVYTNRPPYVLRFRTDGEHWICDQFAIEVPTPAPADEVSPEPAGEVSPEPSA